MSGISRNPMFYTIGIPQLFFMQVDRPDDPKAVDGIALLRAYQGIVNVNTGNVINTEEVDTCLTPEEILRLSYFGNLTGTSIEGDITNKQHEASVDGRKVIDKVVLTRRSLQYTVNFDEINNENMRRFFAASRVHFPLGDLLRGKTMAKNPAEAPGDFMDGEIEVLTSGLSAVGKNSESLELFVTDVMKRRNANLGGADSGGGTLVYPSGVFYFIVGNKQQYPEVEPALSNYRNKMLCAFFAYDKDDDMMKIQSWPEGLTSEHFNYNTPTTFDPRVRVCISPQTVGTASLPTNSKVLSFHGATSSLLTHEWTVTAATASTHTITIQLPKNILKSSIRVLVNGQKYTTKWGADSEAAYDAPELPTSTATQTLVVGSGATTSYFLDSDECFVNYDTGELTLKAGGGVIADMGSNTLPSQVLSVSVSVYTAETSQLIWSGVMWAQNDEVMDTMRVLKGPSEISGCALIVFRNTVGVSYYHVIPSASIRPEGSIESTKDDWMTGGFVVKCLKNDTAYLPYLPKRIRIPYGFTQFYRYIANDNE